MQSSIDPRTTSADDTVIFTTQCSRAARDTEGSIVLDLGKDGPSTGSVAFAYIHNGDIIVNGTGTLQVVDVMRRVVRTVGLSQRGSRTTTAGMPAGVYVLRLINGEKVRTQKIVVR